MKTIRILSVFAVVTAASGAALAHGQGGKMFEKIDTNADGKVTLAEAQAGAQTRFTALDKNKDGAITEAELEGGKGRMMKHADANKDGKITLAELQKAHEDGSLRPAHGDGRARPDDSAN